MMLEALRKEVWRTNKLLPELGLVTFTWGNVSGIDRERGLVCIKPRAWSMICSLLKAWSSPIWRDAWWRET